MVDFELLTIRSTFLLLNHKLFYQSIQHLVTKVFVNEYNFHLSSILFIYPAFT